MELSLAEVAKHLIAALLAGGGIGAERSVHGRAAGFRTHALVGMASSLLMLVTLFQRHGLPLGAEALRADPTRMAQGIMTGIGFLGAGVIFREGLTVRGLTTAASIWMTAAIGILMGLGLYAAGALATGLTLGVLSLFRYVEQRLPALTYARHTVQFARGAALSQAEILGLLVDHGFEVSDVSYALAHGGEVVEYGMAIQTLHPRNLARLAETLRALPQVRGFTITPGVD
jgi:putative Mg2+ transporter-C (MgtC) family protein